VTRNPLFDVVIVGAGLAGAATAAVLGRQGRRVALVDPRPVAPPMFKAEKIEPDQADLLRRLDLMEEVRRRAAPIRVIQVAHRAHVLRSMSMEQYGILYPHLVNAVREQIPASVEQRSARVTAVEPTGDARTVHLDVGEPITARLVVVACGTGSKLYETLGVRHRMVRMAHSLCSGFDIARTDGRPFAFDALTCYPDTTRDGIDYVSLFAIPGRMRVNLFAYLEATDRWALALRKEPRLAMERAFPWLQRLLGDYQVTTKIENRVIDLYVADAQPLDGVVMIGDALQSVCPATGTGLSKVLTDVVLLCEEYVPTWLRFNDLSASVIAQFYGDPRKRACDSNSLKAAQYRRRLATDRSPLGWLHRRKTFADIAVRGLCARLLGYEMPAPIALDGTM
jgi:2-polyprenyl-6-methoxyphenol hydroxylase-like FAD-dependent oxidoreductase